MKALALAAVALLSAGASQDTRAERDLAKALEGRSAGEPRDCIDAGQGASQVIDGDTILFQRMGTVWRNELPASCPGLRPDALLVTEIHGSQICKNDLVRAVDRGSSIPGPQCRLGQFVPYKKAK